jgi:hypothetical protein
MAVVAAMVNAVVNAVMAAVMGGPDHDAAMAVPVDRRERRRRRRGRQARGSRRGRQVGLGAGDAHRSDARTEQGGKDVGLGSHYRYLLLDNVWLRNDLRAKMAGFIRRPDLL